MVLNYKGTITSDMLVAEIQSHVDWFTDVIRAAFFFPGQPVEFEMAPPSALLEYLKNNNGAEGMIQQTSIERLDHLHQDLCNTAREVIEQSQNGQALSLEMFEKLEQFMDSYTLQLRRIEDELLSTGVSIDPVTGLRSVSGMKEDLKREMDRRDRKNVPFCVCNLAIDTNSYQADQYDRRTMEKFYKTVADIMSEMMRSFDDAYHLGKGEFIVCLKHVDLLDACIVMERFKDQVAETSVTGDNGAVLQATLSCGIVEPIPGDEIDTVFSNAKQTRLEAQNEGGDLVFQYNEKSALAKMVTEPPVGF
ncbi:MAG: diguanylate cyclase domain-containing protein [Pseudomonadota bacterium]